MSTWPLLCTVAVLCLQCNSAAPLPATARSRLARAFWLADGAERPAELALGASLAEQDPLAFLHRCRSRYDGRVQDYRCRFIKQELVKGKLTLEQHIDVRFRENPYSVDMHWVRNAAAAKRLNYVAGRWHDGDDEQFHVVPSGVLGLLVPGGVKRDVHGPEARSSSRKPVDQFGFKNSLDLIIKYCEVAKGEPEYHLRFRGLVEYDERPAYLFERRLPYRANDDTYPDRMLDVYIDAELLLPSGVYAYADDEKTQLLGRYLLLDTQLNVGLTDADFQPGA